MFKQAIAYFRFIEESKANNIEYLQLKQAHLLIYLV